MTADESPKSIQLRYQQVAGRLHIDIDSTGFEQDPNLVALYLSYTLDQLLLQAGDGVES